MGLSQDLRFQYVSRVQVAEVLFKLGFDHAHDQDELFVLKNVDDCSFDCVITPFGLRTHRAGNYFTFLGMFVEALTGEFGCIEIEDM